MRTWILVAVGAVLPLVVGGGLGSITTDDGKGTWAYPVQPTAFLLMSVGLALAHALVVVGYLEVSRCSEGRASRLALVGAAGTAFLALCELWSGLVARVDLDSSVLTALDASYAIGSLVIVVGTVGCGVLLRRTGSPLAMPLLVNGLVLAVAALVKFFASDGLGIAALTVWSLLYLWLALRLRTTYGASSTSRQEWVGA